MPIGMGIRAEQNAGTCRSNVGPHSHVNSAARSLGCGRARGMPANSFTNQGALLIVAGMSWGAFFHSLMSMPRTISLVTQELWIEDTQSEAPADQPDGWVKHGLTFIKSRHKDPNSLLSAGPAAAKVKKPLPATPR